MAATILTTSPTANDPRTEKEKMLAGDNYLGMHISLVKERQQCRALIKQYTAADDTDLQLRDQLIKQLFGSTGNNIYVEPPFRCDYGSNIHVGNNFYCNFDCVFLDVCKISMGENCILAPGVHIYTAKHPIDVTERISGLESGAPVSIGDNCWIGGKVIINPGITIGNNVVIGSGAVVTKDLPDNVLAAGVPARIIRHLPAPSSGVTVNNGSTTA